jgi:hypothetical protein
MTMQPNTNPTFDRLEDQINWYDQKSSLNQKWFKRLKFSQILFGALVPLAAGLASVATYQWTTGGLGVLIIILEALQSLNQFQSNWLTYRSTCEQLKHEKFLWLAKAGPYEDFEKADKLLAERIESLISTEHAKWISLKTEKEAKTMQTK